MSNAQHQSFGTESGLNEKMIQMIQNSTNPILVSVSGNSRHGKSTTLCNLINGCVNGYDNSTGPFENGPGPVPISAGGEIFGPIPLKELYRRHLLPTDGVPDADVFFLDTEGLGSVFGFNGANLPTVLTEMQTSSVVLHFCSNYPSVSTSKEVFDNMQLTHYMADIYDIPPPKEIIYATDCPIDTRRPPNSSDEEYGKKLEAKRREAQNTISHQFTCPIIVSAKNTFTDYPEPGDVKYRVYWNSITDILDQIRDTASQHGSQSGEQLAGTIKDVHSFYSKIKSIPENTHQLDLIIKEVCKQLFDEQAKTANEAISKEIKTGKDLKLIFDIMSSFQIQNNNDNDVVISMIQNKMNQKQRKLFDKIIKEYVDSKMQTFKKDLFQEANKKYNQYLDHIKSILFNNSKNSIFEPLLQMIRKAKYQEKARSLVSSQNFQNQVQQIIKKAIPNYDSIIQYLQQNDHKTYEFINNQLKSIFESECAKLKTEEYAVNESIATVIEQMTKDFTGKTQSSVNNYQQRVLTEFPNTKFKQRIESKINEAYNNLKNNNKAAIVQLQNQINDERKRQREQQEQYQIALRDMQQSGQRMINQIQEQSQKQYDQLMQRYEDLQSNYDDMKTQYTEVRREVYRESDSSLVICRI